MLLSITSRLITTALALLLASLQQTSVRKNDTSAEGAPGTVSGRITLEGESVSGAKVAIIPEKALRDRSLLANTQTAVSAKDGTFQFGGVHPGSYLVTASSGVGTLAPEPGRESGKLIVVRESGHIDVELSLIRGGAITGRVAKSDGQPLIAHKVEAIRSRTSIASVPYFMTTVETDDRGVYRIFNLLPGSYVVAANPLQVSRGDRHFYPGGVGQSQASPVIVAPGGEVTNVDITVETLEAGVTYNVAGRVVAGTTGEAVSGIRVEGRRVSGEWRQGFGATTDERGGFLLRDLLPGKYLLFTRGDEGSNQYSENLEFEVTTEHLSGLTLTLRRGVSVSGQIFVEANPHAERPRDLSGLRVGVASPGISYQNLTTNARADGTFTIVGVQPGRYYLNAYAAKEPYCRLLYLEGGTGVSRREFDVSNQPVSGLKAVAECGRSGIIGRIIVQNGQLPEGTRLSVSLESVTRPEPKLGLGAQVGATGQFRFEFAAPGVYNLVTGIFPPPGSRKQYLPIKQSVIVRDGADTEVTVIIDIAQLN